MPLSESCGEEETRSSMRRRAEKNVWLLASAALVTFACAKANEMDSAGPSYQPTDGGTGGGGGSSGQLGSGGSPPATGGFSTGGTGGSAAGGKGGSPTGGSGGTPGGSGGKAAGGNTSMAGTSTNGGTNATAGTTSSGGTNATGGAGSGGMDATGGGATAGSATAGGTAGAGGAPDPNWMPPDMTATAKVVVLYKAQQTAATSSDINMELTLRNQSDSPIDMSSVTVRYWMSSEPPPQINALYYSSTNLSAVQTPVFVGNMGNSYVEVSFRAGGTLPVYVDQNSLNQGKINFGLQGGQTMGTVRFNQANDWSFDATAGTTAKPNPKITVHDGDTLIWGCDPSRVCAETSSGGGEGGAGGVGGE